MFPERDCWSVFQEAAAAAAAAQRSSDAAALTRWHSRLTRIETSVLDSGRTFAHGLPSIGRRAEPEKGYFLCRQQSDGGGGGGGAQEVLLALVREYSPRTTQSPLQLDFQVGL